MKDNDTVLNLLTIAEIIAYILILQANDWNELIKPAFILLLINRVFNIQYDIELKLGRSQSQ